MALLSGGTVMGWGANSDGRLGDGTTENRDVPVTASGLSGGAAISGGVNHTMALLNTGAVATWGDGCAGQLGLGIGASGGICFIPYDFRYVPTDVGGLGDVKGV